MPAFKSYRVAHEYTQTNPATPEKVFPLLCPVREADWIPGWQHNLIYSDSGVAELGCIFTTEDTKVEAAKYSSSSPQRQPGQPTTWICVDYDPVTFRIAYIWIKPDRVATELRIQLSQADRGETHSRIRFRYTGLSPEGNREVERYDEQWFRSKMQGWESAINHYLRTGKMIGAPGWK